MDRNHNDTIYPAAITLTTVPDDLVTTIYGSNLVNSFDHPPYITKLIPHESRRLSFYMNDKGMGAEFRVANMTSRIFFNPEQKSGYTTSFEGDKNFGILHTFNMEGKVQRLLGNWVNDPQSGENVFVKSETVPDDEQHTYQNQKEAFRRLVETSKFFLMHYPPKQPA